MADNVQPDAGEQREESSGLLLSVDPLQGANNYKLAGDDGSDADGTDVTDADGTDTGLDADGMDPLGIQPGHADTGDSSAAKPTDSDGSDS